MFSPSRQIQVSVGFCQPSCLWDLCLPSAPTSSYKDRKTNISLGLLAYNIQHTTRNPETEQQPILKKSKGDSKTKNNFRGANFINHPARALSLWNRICQNVTEVTPVIPVTQLPLSPPLPPSPLSHPSPQSPPTPLSKMSKMSTTKTSRMS